MLGVEGTADPRTYYIPTELMAFLHRAYPSWDIADTSAHTAIASTFPGRAIARRIMDALQAGNLVGTGFAEPQGDRRCYGIFMWPRRPEDYLPGGPKGPGPRLRPPPGSSPRIPWAWLRLSVLGPYAALRWFSNPGVPGVPERMQLLAALTELLRRDSVQILPREVLWCNLAGMRGWRGIFQREYPNVDRALFGRDADVKGRPARG